MAIMRPVEEKLKFAVFIDYDNIDIGVKSTLKRDFDVKCVLEGLKERGEVVSKVAYGNWSRHGRAARSLSEHGVQMVQRDSTPRGDKNGADINLALDALELAFTRDHINAFAIVSGDSDFMALVNKLKQFNKRVYVVGGKAFTSTILQRNCHEFINYEALLDTGSTRSRRGGAASQRARTRRSLPLSRAVSLVDRALHSLDLRGVLPQLGLLKSTMQQLDSAFTERDYGASSFSQLVEKLVKDGFISVKKVDGQSVVERKEASKEAETDREHAPEDALPLLQEVLTGNIDLLNMGIPAKEIQALVQAADTAFKETEFGFSEFAELLNFAVDKGLVGVGADPEHGLRYYPGEELGRPLETGEASQEEGEASAVSEAPDSEEDTSPETKPRRSRARRSPTTRRTRSSRGRGSSRKRATSSRAPKSEDTQSNPAEPAEPAEAAAPEAAESSPPEPAEAGGDAK